jgi:hypothetical protein
MAVALVRGASSPSASRAVALALEIRRTHLMTKSLSIASGLAAAALVGLGLSRAAPGADPPAQLPSSQSPVAAAQARPRGLVAPRLLAATAGRGEAVLFATNARGERITVAGNPVRPAVVAGNRGRPAMEGFMYREETRTLRWAVVVGTVDLRAIRAAVPGPPWPDFGPFWPCKRVDLERQARRDDGGWSDWAAVDVEANLKILDNLTELEAERVRPEARPEALVDPLPFLKAGEWRGVDVETLADERHRDVPRQAMGPDAKPPGAAAEVVMIRAIDFTVAPGATYRYRARVVALDSDPRVELPGPWSGPTGEVMIPKE